MLNKLFFYMPVFIQNLIISIYNSWLYNQRHSGVYKERLEFYSNYRDMSNKEIENYIKHKLSSFLRYSKEKSKWYSKYNSAKNLQDFPILTKYDLMDNLSEIQTISDNQGIVSKTGGTTGASMKVVYTKEDMQERFAVLDSFRAQYGYKLGIKTAWFSGKDLVNRKDISAGRFYKDDIFNKIRFFSTFHINEDNFYHYWRALEKYGARFVVGFPSSVFEICVIAKERGLRLSNKVDVFFPTAENVLPIHRDVISEVLGCKIVDQYASSEGAPFILECKFGHKHMNLLTGVFEVVDDDLKPSSEGEMLVTSFTTHGTPLIRYKIGDRVKLAKNNSCLCGSSFPIVEELEGRTTDYILSPTYGKVNLGNISNSTKSVKGIKRFQVIQESKNNLIVNVESGPIFNEEEQKKFERALESRFGDMIIDVVKVQHIKREASGKFRIVKRLVD
ncbi:phenylacetate--CoA ligase family protein [Vibrio alginolyticus]|uniref:phenylacetate--CoA ligase family protein n=1 Tax=Vibrio alginolyticus TaxID=663 RepID=UPI001110752E|nr:phenylacetate--CoA ligase family protein [Vibrio alginolyticus]TMX52365.1 polysaccharide biosynthesis protein [Vibrio alginolyticus]